MKNCNIYSRFTKEDPFSKLGKLCINCFANQKDEWLQKIKTILFMKLAVVITKQFTLVNLKGV